MTINQFQRTKIRKMHLNIGDAEHIVSPLYADFKESVRRSHNNSDHSFLGTNPFTGLYSKTVV